jgi:hypothetical protein
MVRWLKARGVAGAVIPLAPPAPGSGAGPSVSAAPSVAVVDDAPLRANPAAELQA